MQAIINSKNVMKNGNDNKLKITLMLLRIVFCVVIFLLSVFVISTMLNKGNTDMTTEMSHATFPSVVFKADGMKYNRMKGYITDMDIYRMHDSMTPVGADRKLSIEIDSFDNVIQKISFQVRSLSDGRLIEDTEVLDYIESEEGMTADITLKDLMAYGEEYSLCIYLTTGDNKVIRYYTTVVRNDDTAYSEKLDFSYNFSDTTFDRSRGKELATYLESNEQGDNTTYERVDIHCSLDQICYGTLNISRISEPEAVIRDIDDETAVIDIIFRAEVPENNRKKRFMVYETYRMRLGDERMYLLDYERTMDQIFDMDKGNLTENKAILGIVDRNVVMSENNDGNCLAFINCGRLFAYNMSESKLAYVFGFYDDDLADLRELDPDNGIKIFSVDETGNVRFAVYGYLNRGIHEGMNGISVYYYDSVRNTVEEEAFIPYNGSFEFLEYDISRAAYANSSGEGFFYLNDSFYKVDLRTGSTEILAEDLDSDHFCASSNGQMAAWVDYYGEDRYSSNMSLLNMVTGSLKNISVLPNEGIVPVGFFGDDIVYGIARREDILEDLSGHTVFPMYQIKICDWNGNLVKEYVPQNSYVTDVIRGDGMYTLKLSSISGAGIMTPLPDDQLLDNSTPLHGKNVTELAVTDAYETITQLVLKKSVDLKNLQILNPKQVIYEGERSAKIDGMPVEKNYFVLTYNGRVKDIFSKSCDAVTVADTENGTVRDNRGRTVFRHTTMPEKNQIMAISEEIAQAVQVSGRADTLRACIDVITSYENVPLKEYPAGDNLSEADIIESVMEKSTALDLCGCDLDSVLYYTARDIPVIASMADKYYLIIGYNKVIIVIMDPMNGDLERVNRGEYEEYFANSGNRFYTYSYYEGGK
ncbi:MAG: hypothetical protein K6A72_04835 [Lachnospiraceae bacterium]|nr:hypothetical protein [Lachnospiraceae bacterium]